MGSRKLAALPADYFLDGRQRNKMTEVLLRWAGSRASCARFGCRNVRKKLSRQAQLFLPNIKKNLRPDRGAEKLVDNLRIVTRGKAAAAQGSRAHPGRRCLAKK
jgi:hypothetical protein